MCTQCEDEVIKDNDTQYNGFRIAGEYYGYPKCCIENFIKRVIALHSAINEEEFQLACKITPEQDQHHFGFVPCPECAKKVMNMTVKQTVATLIKDRKCKAPYPNQGKPEDYIKYITKQLKLNKMPRKVLNLGNHNKNFPIVKTTRTKILKVIAETQGKFMTTTHIGKDLKPHTINGIRYKIQDHPMGYIRIFAVRAKDIRLINPQTITELSFQKIHYIAKK